ncbi:MAG: nucleotidyltransferase family protein [Gammaproteobacteria bacterium]|jgi:hypothetical protein|nr:nucleotidyltransferase family protein [Gammaproteobacteria bacterium]
MRQRLIRELAVLALRSPECLPGFTPAEWSLLVRQARNSGVLARLQARLEAQGTLQDVPLAARNHLEAARRIADKQMQSARWEIVQIRAALEDSGIPVVLLKGAAYLAAGLPPAIGRMFADIDIMVPETALEQVEKRLMLHGWMAEKLHPYDQRYYREWMHELPPLRHCRRGTVIDVHHGILPRTSRYALDSRLLHEAAVPVGDGSALRMLAPADMVLHSIVHLFCDGEFDRGLRDLYDIDDLIVHFSADPAFPARLADRAIALGIARPLYYALVWRQRLLGKPAHEDLEPAMRAGAPGPVIGLLMSALLERAMLPSHPSCDQAFTGVARNLLYMRGHWLRMPPRLLLPHLWRKAWRGDSEN